MQEKFNQIKTNAQNELLTVSSVKELGELKVKYVGKSGEITSLLKSMKDIPAEQRSSFGKMVNDLKEEVSSLFNNKEEQLKQKELN